MLPIGAFLVLSLGRSFRRPVRALLEATAKIEAGDFGVNLRSDHNDELGYLIDRTADMATGLKEKQLISDTFGKVVDPRVRDHLLQGNIALGGVRRDAAVLFCDIRGFTTYSEANDEETVVIALNEHLAEMERCIVEQGGMINKFLGDGLLALFGLPIATENPAAEAYAAARRMEYTVIGDTVNLASRLQEYSKRLPGELFLTQAVQERLGEIGSSNTHPGSASVRGRQEKVDLYMYQTDSKE